MDIFIYPSCVVDAGFEESRDHQSEATGQLLTLEDISALFFSSDWLVGSFRCLLLPAES